jgi:hypothetical protein
MTLGCSDESTHRFDGKQLLVAERICVDRVSDHDSNCPTHRARFRVWMGFLLAFVAQWARMLLIAVARPVAADRGVTAGYTSPPPDAHPVSVMPWTANDMSTLWWLLCAAPTAQSCWLWSFVRRLRTSDSNGRCGIGWRLPPRCKAPSIAWSYRTV